MEQPGKRSLISAEGVIGLLVAVVAAAGDMTWYLRSGLVLFGLALISHLAWRIPGKGLQTAAVRTLTGLGLAAILIAITWHPIWEDFQKKHPFVTVTWVEDWINEKWFGPPPPPPPWVSQEEIEAAQKQGRLLVRYSPTELIGMWQRGQDIGLYLNKWIKVVLKFSTPTSQQLNKKKYFVFDAQYPSFVFTQSLLSAYFDQEKWEAKFISLKQGDTIKAICVFDRIDRKEQKAIVMNQTVTYQIDRLFAYNCDLL